MLYVYLLIKSKYEFLSMRQTSCCIIRINKIVAIISKLAVLYQYLRPELRAFIVNIWFACPSVLSIDVRVLLEELNTSTFRLISTVMCVCACGFLFCFVFTWNPWTNYFHSSANNLLLSKVTFVAIDMWLSLYMWLMLDIFADKLFCMPIYPLVYFAGDILRLVIW